jgi:Flp pilus assembly protein TadD
MPSDDEAALSCWEAGTKAMAASDFVAAAHGFREATRIDPDFGEGYVGLGAALAELGSWGEALTAQRQALALLPGDRDATYNLGLCLANLGRFVEAEECFRAVRSRDTSDPHVEFNLGWALAEQSNCEEALGTFVQLLQHAPDYPLAHVMAARELAHFGRNDEAREYLRRALSLDPELGAGWDEIGALRKRLGV